VAQDLGERNPGQRRRCRDGRPDDARDFSTLVADYTPARVGKHLNAHSKTLSGYLFGMTAPWPEVM
jgi:hypothetical protein